MARCVGAVIEKARELGVLPEKLAAADVVRALAGAGVEPKAVRGVATLETVSARGTGKLFATARRHGRSGLIIQLDGASGATRDEAVAAVTAMIERHYTSVGQ